MQDNGHVPADVWKERLIEVSVFLFLIVPSMILSCFVTRQGRVNSIFVAVSTILRDLALVSLILLFVWRNGEPLGVVTVGVMGLIFSLVYLWTGSLMAPIFHPGSPRCRLGALPEVKSVGRPVGRTSREK